MDESQQQNGNQLERSGDGLIDTPQSDALHPFILYSTVAGCVLFAIGLLYVHFIGRRKNRLPDLPHTSTTARFWNELAWEEGGTRDLETIRVRLGGEAEKLLAQHGQRGEEGDESADSL
uniref:Uncharacterized protein n=1 Tax=Globodera rostochiensis TaxID=31243 RepID=A0A914HCY5_GLORO